MKKEVKVVLQGIERHTMARPMPRFEPVMRTRWPASREPTKCSSILSARESSAAFWAAKRAG